MHQAGLTLHLSVVPVAALPGDCGERIACGQLIALNALPGLYYAAEINKTHKNEHKNYGTYKSATKWGIGVAWRLVIKCSIVNCKQ